MKRLIAVIGASLTIGSLLPAAESKPVSSSKPNILFLLSDDHSYPFVGCYGNANVDTPSLDRLAAAGMKFHRFFTGAPQCVPSRATLMTEKMILDFDYLPLPALNGANGKGPSSKEAGAEKKGRKK